MRTRSIFRAEQWWDHKVPPVVAVAALALYLRPGRAATGADLVDLVLLVCSVAGVAAFGHLVNDWADIAVDAQAGKVNRLAGYERGRRATMVAGALAVGLVPWLLLPRRPLALVALAVEVGLLVAYSVPPVRFKARGLWGAAADALYAYTVPFVLTALALGPETGVRPVVVVALGGWGFLVGLRGILWHQIGDAEADRMVAVETAALRLGLDRTERLVASVLVPLEVVSLGVLVALTPVWWLPWLLVGFLIWRSFQVLVLWNEPLQLRSLADRRTRTRIVGFELGNELIERWVPIVALVALAVTSPWWWVAVLVHFFAFHNVIRHFLAHDLWALPDGIERLAFMRRIRADIVAVERQRKAGLAAGPVHLDDPTARRWVFVVCGPLQHLHTLRTAVEHLRPVTDAEIWVLTDPARNVEPVAVSGVDRVVEVATPVGLDDHQASIWLKTSIHRHLPAGEWCYLDSDIIARAPGAEEVFDHRVGPVAFASDVTIRENSVDRFSPWAMTCDCLGYDDEHSCGHLREQIRIRFGLEVPGDWLHWNGGVFVFGPEAAPVLDLWHDRAVASFDWPEWRTRDQGALISVAWSLGLQDLPRLPPPFNFIADLGNGDLCLDPVRGWAHHPSGPWYQARLLHLYTSPLDDPEWDLGRDVEAVVLKRSRVRVYRYRRGEAKTAAHQKLADIRWAVQPRVELQALRLRRLPRRLTPARVARGVLTRLGVERPAPTPDREPSPQRSRQ